MSFSRVILVAWTLASGALMLGEGAGVAQAQCQFGKPTAAGIEGTDFYGCAVSISADYAVVGARLDDDFGSNSGAAYVFQRIGSTWVEQAKLTASDADEGDLFGFAVSISGDSVVVGAHRNTDHGSENGTGSGSAYIFRRSDDTWTEEAKLLASDAQAGDEFGYSVAIDGDVVAIGARRDDDQGESSGSAYIFRRNGPRDGATWTEEQKIMASDGTDWTKFGYSIDLDGDTVAVGAKDDPGYPDNLGSAYVFHWDGDTWTEQAALRPDTEFLYYYFGESVSVSGDYLAVGAGADYEGAGHHTGAAYVFHRTGSTWTQVDKLQASDAEANDEFGHAVGLDGDRLVVGSWLDDDAGSSSGAAYFFRLGGGLWSEEFKLVPSDAGTNDYFGYAVAVDGDNLLIGALGNYFAHGTDPGAAYVFVIDGPDCNQNGFCDSHDIAEGTSADINDNGIPDECECWGDLNDDGYVDLSDLAELLANYGQPSGMTYADGDLDGDGDVDLNDLAELLGHYGIPC